MTAKSLCLILFLVNGCLSEDAPSVVTSTGKILGRYLTSYKGNKYEAYQGIPYAEPPVGDKRFQPPVPIKPWSKQLNATKLKKWCPQGLYVIGSEDCLHLNVYVPTSRKTNEGLPVILYIHGGAFQQGGAKEDEEFYIVDYDVIFVSIQYRLGLLGFLSTEDEVVSGNMGLKDQSIALRWVHDNIENFGGDSKRIALIGESSGAASVHYHYLSSWSTGLFHAGLSLSGTSFAPWSMPERSRDKVFELGQSFNCTVNDTRRMIECLKQQPVDVLVSTGAALPSLQYQPAVPFGPVVEKSATNPFIDEHPSGIISQGRAYDVPWVTGVVSEEGLLPIASSANDVALAKVDAYWFQIAPILLDYFYSIPMDQHNNVSQITRKQYLSEKPINKENFRLLTNLVSDRLFKANAGDATLEQATANKSPVFFYHYAYRATDSISNPLSNSTENLGVAHGDDIGLVLKSSLIIPTKSLRDMSMQRCLINLWTSVARYGVPNLEVEWLRVSPNSTTLDYLQMNDPSSLEMKSSDDFGQRTFWKSIASKEGKI